LLQQLLDRFILVNVQASNRAMLKLGALTKLRRLSLAGTSIKDAGLALVAPLGSLEVLNLEWCSRITNAGEVVQRSFVLSSSLHSSS
jgi:hypothetical protein